MFPALYALRYVIAAGVILAAVGAFYWHAYSKGEEHAIQKQQQHDNEAKGRAEDVRRRDGASDPDKLLQNDPFIRR
jgi:hypothetical protein